MGGHAGLFLAFLLTSVWASLGFPAVGGHAGTCGHAGTVIISAANGLVMFIKTPRYTRTTFHFGGSLFISFNHQYFPTLLKHYTVIKLKGPIYL